MSRRVGYSPAMTSEQTFGDWYNERRLLLNPWVAGAVVGAAGVVNSWLFPMWPHTVAWVAIASLCLLIWTVTLTHSAQRFFYRIFIAVGAAWMFLLQTHWAAEHWRAFAVAWFVATACGWVGYWTDQREREKIRVRAEIDSWPGLAHKLGIPKTWMSQKVTTATGWTRRLSWAPGEYSRSQIMSLKERLESALEIPAGQLRMKAVTDGDANTNSNAVDLEVNAASTLRKRPLEFDAPTMRSICDLMYVGDYENGNQLKIYWFEQGFGGIHTLAAGMTRSGKSGLYRLMLGETAPCDDVVRLGIDAKGGMALRPWAPLFDWLVCGRTGAAAEETAAMLEWLDAVMAFRETYAAERGWDVWKVSRRHPLIILYVDEAAEVFGLKYENFAAVQLVEKIGRMGAGVGVLLCAATQYPTVEAIASSQIQSQIGRRFCFRVERTQHQHVILPKGTEVDATFPDKPTGSKGAGWCFFSDLGVMDPVPLRVRNLKPEQVFALVESYYHVKCPLDAGSATQPVRREAYEARKRWTLNDIRQREDGDDLWADERAEFGPRDDEADVTVPVQQNVTQNVTEGVTQTGPADVTVGVTTTKEQVMGDTVEIDGMEVTPVHVPLGQMIAPRTEKEAAELAAAVAEFYAQSEEWPTERAELAFWTTLKKFTGTPDVRGPGVRVGQLSQECHRSLAWVHDRMDKGRREGLIVPVKMGSPYYRIADGRDIPALSAHAE